jgi:hypothetical protein
MKTGKNIKVQLIFKSQQIKGPFGMAPTPAPEAVFQLRLLKGSKKVLLVRSGQKKSRSQRGFGRWSQKMQLSPVPCQVHTGPWCIWPWMPLSSCEWARSDGCMGMDQTGARASGMGLGKADPWRGHQRRGSPFGGRDSEVPSEHERGLHQRGREPPLWILHAHAKTNQR